VGIIRAHGFGCAPCFLVPKVTSVAVDEVVTF
jgi:hypothetical protein